jgi:hypothetical protein
VTNLTHQISHRVFDNFHDSSDSIMSSVIDLEAQQVARAAPCAGAFSLFLITVEVVTACKEEVEGAETHEMGILGPHTSSIASSLQSVSTTGQDINGEARLVVSQAKGVALIWPCCRIPRRSFCFVSGSGGSDAPEMNINQSRNSDDVSGTTGDILTQVKAQTRARFHTIVGISMT